MALSHLHIRRRRVVRAAKKVKEDCEPAEVLPGVYLGSIGAAHSKEVLQQLGVTHILTVAAGFAPKHPDDFTYCLVDVMDRPEVRARGVPVHRSQRGAWCPFLAGRPTRGLLKAPPRAINPSSTESPHRSERSTSPRWSPREASIKPFFRILSLSP